MAGEAEWGSGHTNDKLLYYYNNSKQILWVPVSNHLARSKSTSPYFFTRIKICGRRPRSKSSKGVERPIIIPLTPCKSPWVMG